MNGDSELEVDQRDSMSVDALHISPAHISDPAPPREAPSDIFFAAVKMTRMPMTVNGGWSRAWQMAP